jgi:pyruvate dehydrogenase E2 component (dihydrolipoamide acetyltransferase)
MATEVILPKVDMDMSTGTISVWHVKDGDTVKKSQALFDIETDKAAMEIESPADGVIRIGTAPVKATLPIGTVVAMIYAAGEEPKAFTGGATAPAAAPAASAPVAAAAAPAAVVPAPDTNGKTRATPLARRLAKQQGISLRHPHWLAAWMVTPCARFMRQVHIPSRRWTACAEPLPSALCNPSKRCRISI